MKSRATPQEHQIVRCEECKGELVRMRAWLDERFRLVCGPCYLATATPREIGAALDAIQIDSRDRE
jgi:hypothetical protein